MWEGLSPVPLALGGRPVFGRCGEDRAFWGTTVYLDSRGNHPAYPDIVALGPHPWRLQWLILTEHFTVSWELNRIFSRPGSFLQGCNYMLRSLVHQYTHTLYNYTY